MSIMPFQSKFDKSFPVVIGNAEYHAECELIEAMDIEFKGIGSEGPHDVTSCIALALEKITSAIPEADVLVVNLTDPVLNIPTVRVFVVGLQEMAKTWTYLLPRTFQLPVQMGRCERCLDYCELHLGLFPH